MEIFLGAHFFLRTLFHFFPEQLRLQISQKQNEPDIDEVEASGIIKTLENRLNILQDEHEELVEKCKYI